MAVERAGAELVERCAEKNVEQFRLLGLIYLTHNAPAALQSNHLRA
jgi:hypothetical protein